LQQPKTAHTQINARLETGATKPMFASSFVGAYCIACSTGSSSP